MPEPQLQYNIFDLGFNKHLSRETPLILGELGLASLMGSSFYESSPNIYEGTMNNIPTKSISGAFDSSGNVITELINEKLNTQTKEILGDFTFGASGAIKMITDANNGLWISPTGILGKKAGATTFAIDTSGNATFAGTLSAASGTFEEITAGTLTGLTIQSASANRRIVLTSGHELKFYDGGGVLVSLINTATGTGQPVEITTPGETLGPSWQWTGRGQNVYLAIDVAQSGTPEEGHIILRKAEWTAGAIAPVVSESPLGIIRWEGYAGSPLSNYSAAIIKAFVDGTPGASDMPGRICFYTSPDGSATPAERMRIDNAGRIYMYNLPTSNPVSAGALWNNNGVVNISAG